jgi:predicted DNA-binding transcriptional regulator AlpA
MNKGQEYLITILEKRAFWKKIAKRELDRSFVISVDESNPKKIIFKMVDVDSGNENMSPTDVACFLNVDRDTVLRLNAARAQSQSRHPFPKGFMVGKVIRWYRPDVIAWRDRVRKDGNK